ncbi:MAG: prepilin-type N-terminal cleavage/methylation domain-containing protein, partial [Candidatus Gastranaerophilales bacterium]|nr:prepilin-type N-terminal cleavage/methylation domain-containing protein [Candidatus Gastranaerophilales bacterium]
MVKNKKGFSLTEALILLVILAIAIAASTPMITRKIINTTEAGTTLSGGTHGRYEIFTKEIVTFDGKSYEKTTDPDPDSPGSLSAGSGGIVVFRRLLDDEYIQVVRDKGHKATAGVTNDIPDLD